jgi:cytoskeletal protein CcmA (bactofilin family)
MSAKRGGSLNGFLDRGARLEGTLSFDDVFRIDGQFKGTITSEAELVVGEGGVVEGDVRVGRLAVSGTIKGSVHAKERVELHAGARVFADIKTPTLVVEEGAVIQGPVESGPPRPEDAKKQPTQAT